MKTTIVIRHKVGSFNTWLKGHQDRLDLFGPAISGLKTFQDGDDPNSVVLIMEVTDMEKFQTILSSPDTNALKTKHSVEDPITVSMPVNV